MTTQTDKSGTYTEPGVSGMVADWSADKQAFDMPWGKLMMWIFLLSDTFIFSIFLTSYMNVRMSATDQWPNPSEVFALEVAGVHLPLLLIAIIGMSSKTSPPIFNHFPTNTPLEFQPAPLENHIWHWEQQQ